MNTNDRQEFALELAPGIDNRLWHGCLRWGGYVAGVDAATTYNELLGDAKEKCAGEFKVLDSKS